MKVFGGTGSVRILARSLFLFCFIVAVSSPFYRILFNVGANGERYKLILLALFRFLTPKLTRLKGGVKRQIGKMGKRKKSQNPALKTIIFLGFLTAA